MAKLNNAQIETVNRARRHMQELAELFTQAAAGNEEAQNTLLSCASVLAADAAAHGEALNALAYPVTAAFLAR